MQTVENFFDFAFLIKEKYAVETFSSDTHRPEAFYTTPDVSLHHPPLGIYYIFLDHFPIIYYIGPRHSTPLPMYVDHPPLVSLLYQSLLFHTY